MTAFRGILPALVTPFDEDDRFNPSALEQLLEHLYAADVHGVYVCGSTGEGWQQSLAQRKHVAEVAVKSSPPGKLVVVHVGAASTSDAIELIKHASRTGARAVSSLPPFGNYSFDEVKAYYGSLAEASDIPLLLYYFPALNSVISSTDQIIELCQLPNVIGLKFTAYDLFKLATLKESGAVVFNGYDEVLVAGLLMGADGGIGTIYSIVPRLFMQVYRLAQNSQWEEARRVQQRINELIRILVRYPLFPATKMLLKSMGIDCGRCLSPRRALTTAEETQLRGDIEASNFAYLLTAELKIG